MEDRHMKNKLGILAFLILASGLIGSAVMAQPGATQATCEITIVVPADAEVFFDGQPTKQKGTARLYVTPPLVVGKKYSYEVLARRQDGRKPVEQTRTVEVGGGLRVRVDFLAAGPAPTGQVRYKMTTPIPPGIAAPDKMETRFGTLHFFDGFPDKASSEKLYDNLDFQRAVQAYLLGLPVVSQVANRKGMLEWGPANATVPIYENMMNAKTLALTANNNTPYTWFWIDLHDGPLVLEVPPKVLGVIDDMWYHWVGDVGITGPDKGEGGKYLLLPPGYKGEVPKGYFVIRSATYSTFVVWRSFLVDGDPKPGVDLVKKFTKVYPLAKAANPPAVKFVDVTGKAFNTIAPADYSFWECLNQVVQDEPTDAIDATTLGLWASVGIVKGKPFAPNARMKKILTEAAAVGDATLRAVTYRWPTQADFYYPNSAWRPIFFGGYKFEEKGARLLDAYGYFFYATLITPALEEKLIGKGSQYAAAFVDAKGQPFDGGKNYKLHIPPNAPAKDFWSVIIYDNQTRSMLQTDQHWPAVSSQTKGLLVNKDGSVDVYFGPKAPAGKENNWIQTIPGKGWNTLLRLYGPLEPWFDKTWRPGEIELAE
jgi:uncharacterized protein (TIGR03000 family)